MNNKNLNKNEIGLNAEQVKQMANILLNLENNGMMNLLIQD